MQLYQYPVMNLPRKLFLPLLCLLSVFTLLPAQKHTISGYVQDVKTGEKLIGAKVFDPVLKLGAVTNTYGYYSITLETDTFRLTASYLGYQTYSDILLLDQDLKINLSLSPTDIEMNTVEITAEESVSESANMGTIDVPVEQIKALPALLGETDVIKVLQLLPGVQSGSEGSSGLFVRGGSPDQNLILLDGVPLYNVQHLFGFFSVFNADALKNVTLIKGGFPARYGGRLSAVLDINMKDGNMEEVHGEGMIGLIASKLTVEGPIKKGKTSFLISGRRTYIDLLAQPLIRAASDGNSSGGYFFYDVNAKVNHIFSEKDRLYLSGYMGRDRFYARDKYTYDNTVGPSYTSETNFGLGWGNAIGALRWNHLFSPRLFGNLTLTASDYDFDVNAEFKDIETENGVTTEQSAQATYLSGIRDFSAKLDFDFYANPTNLVRFGAYGIHHTFTPGISQFKFESTGNPGLDTTLGSQITKGIESGLYIEDEIRLGERFRGNIGLHASAFTVNQKSYYSVQPRFTSRYFIDDNWAVKGSFATMAQYLHLLTNSNVGLPTDLWVPATERIRPQTSWIGAVGLARTFTEQNLEFSVEGYYKHMDNVIAYKEGAAFLDIDEDWQDKIEVGTGWSYGLEALLQRKKGKTTGWIGYTLSWTNRQFDNLNDGNVFPFKYDRRHDFSLALTHRFSDRIDVGLTYVYGTGYAVTLPVARSLTSSPSPLQQLGSINPNQIIETRNGYRMRNYHRMDIGVNFTKEKKRFSRTWSLGLYNAYSRLNPFFLYFDNEPRTNRTVLKQVSLFPMIPSIAYKFKF